MKVVTLRDAKAHLSAVVEDANTERVLITSNGEPAAVLIGVKGQDMEEVMLTSNPKFWAMIEESRRNDRILTAAEVRARIAQRAAKEAPTKPARTRRTSARRRPSAR
jgi:prevent-host-death family protein